MKGYYNFLAKHLEEISDVVNKVYMSLITILIILFFISSTWGCNNIPDVTLFMMLLFSLVSLLFFNLFTMNFKEFDRENKKAEKQSKEMRKKEKENFWQKKNIEFAATKQNMKYCLIIFLLTFFLMGFFGIKTEWMPILGKLEELLRAFCYIFINSFC